MNKLIITKEKTELMQLHLLQKRPIDTQSQ